MWRAQIQILHDNHHLFAKVNILDKLRIALVLVHHGVKKYVLYIWYLLFYKTVYVLYCFIVFTARGRNKHSHHGYY